jgi:hypothetical protein
MALMRCEDCGHMVSDLAFACPQCGRPIAALDAAGRSPAELAPSASGGGKSAEPGEVPARSPVWTADAVAHPVVNAWLEDIRKARQLPARTKVCGHCNADVALDTFRQKVGDGYLCSDCWEKEEARLAARSRLLRRLVLIGTAVAVVGAITAGAVTVGPALLTPRTARHGK